MNNHQRHTLNKHRLFSALEHANALAGALKWLPRDMPQSVDDALNQGDGVVDPVDAVLHRLHEAVAELERAQPDEHVAPVMEPMLAALVLAAE